MTRDPGAIELARIVELLAPALSQGRRRQGRLVTGSSRAFFTSRGGTKVFVPFPLPDVADAPVPAVRVATCGLALQACPTKEALAELPLADLRPRAGSVVAGRGGSRWRRPSNVPGLGRICAPGRGTRPTRRLIEARSRGRTRGCDG
jgi:hypothetical protein